MGGYWTGTKPSRYSAVPGQEDEGDEGDEESTSGRWDTFEVEGAQHPRGVWGKLRSWKPLGLEQSPELWAIAIGEAHLASTRQAGGVVGLSRTDLHTFKS